MITLKSTKSDVALKIPTKVDEVSAQDLAKLTNNFKIADNFCVIALLYKINVADIIFAANGAKNLNKEIGTTVELAKLGKTTITTVPEIGDIVTVDRSTLERGHHLGINSGASMNRVTGYISADNKLRDDLRQGLLLDDKGEIPSQFIVIEFKLIPITAIVSSISRDAVLDDPYKVIVKGA